MWHTDGWLGQLSTPVSTTSKTLVVSTETDRGSYSQADCWLQDVEGGILQYVTLLRRLYYVYEIGPRAPQPHYTIHSKLVRCNTSDNNKPSILQPSSAILQTHPFKNNQHNHYNQHHNTIVVHQ